jgi:methylated-DNA-[protein]-cysteine S-methyltransferase
MREVLQLLLDRVETPIGEMLVVADLSGNLRAVDWSDYEERMLRLLRLHYGNGGFEIKAARNPHGLADAMHRYFSGDLGVIDTLPVATAGTPFQRDVWRALRSIRCGEPISYLQLAERIGRPKAVRAIGLANGANPVGVVVPCHRVIGANGSLTGYGGGLERKRWLLEHEARATLKKILKLPLDCLRVCGNTEVITSVLRSPNEQSIRSSQHLRHRAKLSEITRTGIHRICGFG